MQIEDIIKKAAAMGANEALVRIGYSNGEITERQARKAYGTWFTKSVANNRIRPARVGEGKNATKWYRISDLQGGLLADELEATLKRTVTLN